MTETTDGKVPRNVEGAHSDTGCPMCDAGHPASQRVRTYGDYEVDGPPVWLESNTEYRVELNSRMGEAILRHADGRAVARLLHRDYAAAIRRAAATIRATEDADILDRLRQSPIGRSLRGAPRETAVVDDCNFFPLEMTEREVRERFAAAGVDPDTIVVADYAEMERRALDTAVKIKREHLNMEKLLRTGILGAIGAAGMMGGRPHEPLGGWNPALGRRHAEPELTPERMAKRAARRKANAARGRTKKGKK